jgi:hypothetical protein
MNGSFFFCSLLYSDNIFVSSLNAGACSSSAFKIEVVSTSISVTVSDSFSFSWLIVRFVCLFISHWLNFAKFNDFFFWGGHGMAGRNDNKIKFSLLIEIIFFCFGLKKCESVVKNKDFS